MGEPKFDRRKRYLNKEGRKFGQGVWIDKEGNMIKPGQGVSYDKSPIVTQYNTDGSISVFNREQWHDKKTKEHELNVLLNDRKWGIPYIPEKRMVIHTGVGSSKEGRGKVVISENLLDSIAANAKKAGLPFSTALGMAYQESTIGNNRNRAVGKSLQPWMRFLDKTSDDMRKQASSITYPNMQSPTLLISNWKQRDENPFAAYLYNGKGYLRDNKQSEEYYSKDFFPSVKKGNKYQLEDMSPLQHGFRAYKEEPKKYNPGDPYYPDKVEAARKELVNFSPEIKDYMKKHNLHGDGGYLDNAWDSLSMQDKAEMMKVAIANGITTLPEIRKAYNEFAKGGNLMATGGVGNTQKAMSYLMDRGISKTGASAIVGTLQAESNLNLAIHAQMKGDNGEGIAQWTGSRKKVFWNTLEKIEPGAQKKYRNIVNVPLERQLDVVLAERPDVTQAISNAQDVHTATDIMLRGYENGGGTVKNMASKGQMDRIYGKWNNGYDRQIKKRAGNATHLLGLTSTGSELPILQPLPLMDIDPSTTYQPPKIENTLFTQPQPEMPVFSPEQEKMEGLQRMGTVMGLLGQETPFQGTVNNDPYSLLSIVNGIYGS